MEKVEWKMAPVGVDTLSMARDFPRWVSRREERVRFVNHEITERSVRVDLDLSSYRLTDTGVFDLTEVGGRYLVPVAVISRAQHTTFQIVNESDDRLPRLTADEERFIVYSGLAFLVERELRDRGVEMEAETRNHVWSLVHEPSGTDLASNPQIEQARENPMIAAFLDEASRSHYLLVPLDPSRGDRRVITYSWLEPARTRSEAAEADPGVLTYSTAIRTAGDCRSYHFELSAPPALRVREATLSVQPAGDRAAHLEEVHDDDRLATHAHLHLAGVPPTSPGEVTCELSLTSTGLVRTALVSSVFSALIVGAIGLLIWLDGPLDWVNGSVDASSSTALVLLVPAFAGPILAATSNHGLTTTLQLPVRFTMWAGGAGPFLAALALATGVQGPLRAVLWVVAGVVCVGAVVVNFRNWNRLR